MEKLKEDYISLISLLEQYIKLLGSELDRSAVFLHAHNWEFKGIEEGERLRKEIKTLKEKLMLL